MSIAVGDYMSLSLYGILTDNAATVDNTPPSPPTLGTPSVTTTTATIPVTVPVDADYDHCDFEYYVNGSGSPTQVNPFTGGLSSLSAGTTHQGVAHAFDTLGNRSRPSNIVTFTTLRAAGGTYNLMLQFKTDESATWEVSQNCSIALDAALMPILLRGDRGQYRITMTEVDQNVKVAGIKLYARVTLRRSDR